MMCYVNLCDGLIYELMILALLLLKANAGNKPSATVDLFLAGRSYGQMLDSQQSLLYLDPSCVCWLVGYECVELP